MTRNIFTKNLTASVIATGFIWRWWYAALDWIESCRCGLIVIGAEG